MSSVNNTGSFLPLFPLMSTRRCELQRVFFSNTFSVLGIYLSASSFLRLHPNSFLVFWHLKHVVWACYISFHEEMLRLEMIWYQSICSFNFVIIFFFQSLRFQKICTFSKTVSKFESKRRCAVGMSLFWIASNFPTHLTRIFQFLAFNTLSTQFTEFFLEHFINRPSSLNFCDI